MGQHKSLNVYLFFVLLIVTSVSRIVKCQAWVVDDTGCRTPDRGVGDCIPVKKCKPITDYLASHTRPFPSYVTERLQAYTCSYRRNIIHVCCPSTAISIVEPTTKEPPTTTSSMNLRVQDITVPMSNDSIITNTSTIPTDYKAALIEEPPDVTDHKKLYLLPCEDCGYFGNPDRIRNGQKAELNEFPWMALLSYNTSRGPAFKCGGTIINDRYILTAAHCITNLKSPLLGVRVGEHDIQSKIDCQTASDGTEKCNGPVQDLAIEKIIPHPDYNTKIIRNDVGLLRVSKMNLNVVSVRPVCLPLELARDQKFNYAVVTGWGYTGEGDGSSNILLKVELPIIVLEQCQKVYQAQSKVRITQKQLCAGGKDNKDSCPGDSGGPLQSAAFLYDDVRYVQYGIVSFGPKYCGLNGFPGVYTKVSYYMKWILDMIDP